MRVKFIDTALSSHGHGHVVRRLTNVHAIFPGLKRIVKLNL